MRFCIVHTLSYVLACAGWRDQRTIARPSSAHLRVRDLMLANDCGLPLCNMLVVRENLFGLLL